MSVVGLGCNNFGWNIDEDATRCVLGAALDAGVTFLDTADMYGGTHSEEFMGRALGTRRDEAVLATKFGQPINGEPAGASPSYVKSAVEASLRRLATDRIDLYQLHKPDPATPIADTLGALGELVQQGKVREIGCSNFSVEQLREADIAAAGARFVSLQNNYSLLHREPEEGVIAECERLGIGFIPYFPLASGLLTGKYRKGQPLPEGTRIKADGHFAGLLTEKNLDIVEGLIAFAETRGHTILDIAFSWLLAQPSVASVIAGATRPEQVLANANASDWTLSPADLAEIDTLLKG